MGATTSWFDHAAHCPEESARKEQACVNSRLQDVAQSKIRFSVKV